MALRKDPSADCPTRMISANWCWTTQPLALFVAKMFRTMVVKLPEYTKDSDSINRLLINATVELDCKAWHGKITMADGRVLEDIA